MPPADHDPDTSELVTIVGKPIEDSALPFAKDRRVHDMGPHLASVLFKRAEDTLDYFIPMGRFLEPGEVITGVTASYGPETAPPLLVTQVGFASMGVVIWVTAGGDDARYELQALVATSQGREKLYRFVLRTRGTADYELPEPPITVTVEPITVGVGMGSEDGAVPGVPALSLSAVILSFEAILPGETSLPKTFTMTNTGTAAMTIASIAAIGDFIVSSDSDGTLSPGEVSTVSVIFAPTAEGVRSGAITIQGALSGSVALTGIGATEGTEPDLPEASVADGVLGAGAAIARLLPASIELEAVVGEADSAVATLSNIGGAAMDVTSIGVSAGFTQTNDCGETLAAGASCSITVSHAPDEEAVTTGALSVVTSVGNVSSTLSGTGTAQPEGPTLGPLSTLGNQLVDEDGQVVRLRSINWFGAESPNHFPHGIWANSYKAIIDQIAAWGFNCIRMPFSGDTFKAGNRINGVSDDFPDNDVFVESGNATIGYTYVHPFVAMDAIVAYAATKGLYIVFDHHRRTAGAGPDGAPTSGSYTLATWLGVWSDVVNRYKNAPNVIGADVCNEPHLLGWNEWAGLAETCGDHIHTIAPHWLIICEGVASYNAQPYWWGGQLAGVADRPVVLAAPNKLVYSPHEYGQSVGSQTWLRYDGNPSQPPGYPANLYDVWQAAWGFIFEQNIAPIWIGEFGGHYGVDGDGNPTKPHGAYEQQWTAELVKYLNGDFDGSGTSDLPGGKLGMSFAYWCLNPNSGDTGGLLRDDWMTPQSAKIALLEPLLA